MEIRGSGVAAAEGGLGGWLGVWRSADGTLKEEVECEPLDVSYQNIKRALGEIFKKPAILSLIIFTTFNFFFSNPSECHLLSPRQSLGSSLGLEWYVCAIIEREEG